MGPLHPSLLQLHANPAVKAQFARALSRPLKQAISPSQPVPPQDDNVGNHDQRAGNSVDADEGNETTRSGSIEERGVVSAGTAKTTGKHG